MSIDYTQSIENLFESINVIVSKKLEDVSFDTTIICTVVDDSDRKNGKYRVTNGTTVFDAYSDSADYRTDDSVRVQVLNGDYSDKKYIVGKAVTSTDNAPLTYVSPIDTIVNITGNLVDDKGSKCGLIANGTETSINLWGADLSEHEIWTNGIYSALTIRADFRTLLDNYDLKNGSYGLRVHLFIKPSKESAYYVDNYFDLDSSEMFGNPYAFSVYTKQAKKVNLTTTGIVQHIVLSAYQKANFINHSGNLIGAAQRENIFIKNIEIGFGSDLEKIDDNTVKIYTNSNPQYKYYLPTKETNLKTLGLLWYNKNDNNEYLGFSDGIYDPEYDEIEYLEKSKEDARLAAYMAREGIPSDPESLDLAANIDEAIPILQAARKLVTGDLINQLRSFKDQLSGTAANLLTDYTKDSNTNELTAAADGIKENEEALKKMYADILAYWYAKSEKETPKDVEGVDDYAAKILVQHEKIVKDVKNLLSDVRDECKENLAGYLGVCDNYEARVNRVLNNITKTLSTLPGITDDYKVLEAYQSKTNFKTYQRKDFSDYNNKYCVYWYRANKDAEADGVMAAGWERIEAFDNFGIPKEKGDIIEGKVRNQVKLPEGENIAEYYMNADLVSETFKAVVFYNHDKFVSDELLFTNADDIPDKSLLDKSDALVINHATDSRDNYNCYAMTNYLLNAADSSIEREVTCHYDGLLAGDEVLANARAYWYIPEDSTMITVNEKKLTTNGFTADKSRPKTGYICYYKLLKAEVTEKDEKKSYNFGDNLHFWYRIKPYYEQSAAVNDIQCEVILADENDEDYIAGQLTLTFGQQSTSGTKYTMVVTPATTQRGTTASDNYLMSLHLEDAEGNLITMSTEGLPEEESETAYGLKVSSVMSRVVSGSEYAEAGSVAPSCSNAANTTEAERWTLTAEKNNFGIYQATASIGIATKEIDKQGNEKVVKTRYVDLTAWFSVPWTADGGYYLSGPTSIVYNNLGTLDNTIAYQTPYKLFNDSHELVENVVWSIDSCPKNGKEFKEDDMDLRYMPKLNADNTLSPASTYLNNLEYYPVLIAKQGDNILWRQPIIIMQNQYASNMLNDWDGSFQIDEENGTIMSTMIAAGRKNAGNKFEGVVMGCVAQELEIDELNDSADGIGVYGFHDGTASFGILADGTAFMGKAGNGRILINGNKGTIESAAYSQTKQYKNEDNKPIYENPAGMQIDLENGKLVMRSASLGANKTWYAAGVGPEGESNGSELNTVNSRYAVEVTMDANAENNSYLDITTPWWNGSEWVLKPLIHIGDTIEDGKIKHSYYLQSQNYKNGTYSWEDTVAHGKTGAGTFFDLVEGTIDAYNFKLQSKNVLIDSSEKADPYFVVKSDADLKDSNGNSIGNRNLIYCGKGLYYLQSGDYQENVAGTKIDLTLGKISSYNFELSAGTEDTGLIEIKSAPEDGSYFLNVQKGDGAYIRLSKDGVLSLKASTFTLTAGNTYFSSSAAKYKINGSDRDVVLRMGDRFGVSADGKLYCADATVSGTIDSEDGKIGGWLINKSSLYNGAMKISSSDGINFNGLFKVDSTGKLTATSGEIGGWEISEDKLSKNVIELTKEGTIQSTKDNFKVDGMTGQLTATSAVLTSLTVKSSLLVDSTATASEASLEAEDYGVAPLLMTGEGIGSLVDQVVWDGGGGGSGSADALCTINGNTYIGGSAKITGSLKIEGVTTISQSLTINANTVVNGDFWYKGKIYCQGGTEGTWDPGINGTIYYFGEGDQVLWWKTKTLKKASFRNGILINADADDSEFTSSPFSDLGEAGTFLESTGESTQWTKLYAPTSIPTKGKVWGGTGTTQNPPDWVTMAQVLGVSSSYNGQFLQAYSEAGTTDVRWKKLYAPISAGQSGQVWGTDGTTPAWKTIGATLVNFTNGTATITKKTSGSTTYYVVSKTTSVSTAAKSEAKTGSGTIPNYYLCWNDSAATGQKVTTNETTSLSTAQTYDHYTQMGLNHRTYTYTYYDVVTSTKDVTVSSEVQININLS